MASYKYFKREEFACRCGCGLNNISDELAGMLDNARELAGVAFTVTSGCRCAKHNKATGGKPDSSHLSGLAVDIAAPVEKRYAILAALINAGFKRIGISFDGNFIHADIDKGKPITRVWGY